MFKLISLMAFIVLISGPINGQKKVSSIAELESMAGCWERRDAKNELLVSEQWMLPAGTSILGMGRTVKKGQTVDYEYMRIEQRVDGIYFVAQPKANTAATTFKLISSTHDELVFENKDHDFPQRVIYKMSGAKLIGRIEGNSKGKFVGIDFPMDRVECSK